MDHAKTGRDRTAIVYGTLNLLSERGNGAVYFDIVFEGQRFESAIIRKFIGKLS